jgi:predicted DNA-binding protein with PD1-like motif
MKIHEETSGLLVVSLARGDDVRSSVEGLADERGIVGARLSAIGAVEDPELGYYDLSEKTYLRSAFPGMWELVSFEGNLSLLDGRPFMHAHAAIGGPDWSTRGGHLFEARVGVVMELFIEPLEAPLPRIMCPAIGLPRWEPQDD